MNDKNAITVSFDQTTAVRNRDGLRLKAVPCDPAQPDAGYCTRCDGCQVPGAEGGGCDASEYSLGYRAFKTEFPRFCMRTERKDGRNIRWGAV